MSSALERPGQHRGIAFTVRINAMPDMRFRWTFNTAKGLNGHGITDRGREAAFEDGRRAADVAIDIALDG